jgi:Tfp pilus assembly protein PilN
MIEINLLPGASKRRRSALAMPAWASGGKSMQFDRIKAFVIAGWVIGPLVVLFLFFGGRNRIQELEVAIEGAQRDSIRYAAIIAANEELQARQATITEKLEIIQEIDAARYIWAHILDEVSRAMPPHLWLITMSHVAGAPSNRPRFTIEGRAGHTRAMTQYVENLEASPFISGVRIADHQQVVEGGRAVYNFRLEMGYREPPPDAIRTVPLFVDLETQ